MFQAVWRLRIPPAILENIKSLYANSLFQVIQGENASEWQKQRTGIRQGCPLSPYLFILTMHVMFHDVKQRLHDPHHIKTFQGINFQELLYADDTLIIAKSAKTPPMPTCTSLKKNPIIYISDSIMANALSWPSTVPTEASNFVMEPKCSRQKKPNTSEL